MANFAKAREKAAEAAKRFAPYYKEHNWWWASLGTVPTEADIKAGILRLLDDVEREVGTNQRRLTIATGGLFVSLQDDGDIVIGFTDEFTIN